MKKIIPFLLLLFLLGIIYLPGPNGLFALIRRYKENQKLQREILDLRIENILTRAKAKIISSSEYWKEFVKKKQATKEERKK
ncbi:MAG: hypothetical protein ABIK81_04595 [candidate division WOR-3 bacterium]